MKPNFFFPNKLLLAGVILLCVSLLHPGAKVKAAILTVCSASHPTGPCQFNSIGAAIGAANSGDIISISGEVFTEKNLVINKNITITGQGSTISIIQASETEPPLAADLGRVFTVNAGFSLTLEYLTVRHGYTQTSGGGIYTAGTLNLDHVIVTQNYVYLSGSGGGIFASGVGAVVNLNNVILSNNTAINSLGGGLDALAGSVVYIQKSRVSGNRALEGAGLRIQNGSLAISHSTFEGNQTASAGTASGGALYLAAAAGGNLTATIDSTTISSNFATSGASGGGGGIAFFNGSANAVVMVKNSTISANRAVSGGGIYIEGSAGTLQMVNSIVSGNGESDCAAPAGELVSGGYNLFGLSTGCPSGNATDQSLASAGVSPLLLHGEIQKLHVLFDGSKGLDRGSCPGSDEDQRSKLRPVDLADNLYPDASDGCDIGATERQADEATAQVNSFAANVPTEIGDTGATVTLRSGLAGTVTVYRRGDFPGGGFSSGELPVIWSIDASGESFMVDLKLCTEQDTSGMSLAAWKWIEDALKWDEQLSLQQEDCVLVEDITQFSSWTVASDAPTAVTLSDLSAASHNEGNFDFLLVSTLVLLVVASFWLGIKRLGN